MEKSDGKADGKIVAFFAHAREKKKIRRKRADFSRYTPYSCSWGCGTVSKANCLSFL